MIRPATTGDASAVDVFAFLAFFGAILSVFASLLWPALMAPIAVLIVATAFRRSTRTIGKWAAVGVGAGIAAVAAIVTMFVAMGGNLFPTG